MRYPLRTLVTLVGSTLAGAACATDADLGPAQEPPFCIDLHGAGQTDGSMNALRSHGDFMFGSDPRPAFVALYIFDRRDGENGGQYADVNYQFLWDGESFSRRTTCSSSRFSGMTPFTSTFP